MVSQRYRHAMWAMLLVLALPACSRNSENNANNNNGTTPAEDMAQTTPAEDMDSSKEDMPADEDMGMAGDMAPGGLEIPDGCNPVAFEKDCLLPYPSNVFLVDDANTPSGHRVELTNAARLKIRKRPVDLLNVHPVDGFSHHQPIQALFREEIDDANLVFHDEDPAPTTQPDSVTILLNADTGEALAHWAEVERQTSKVDERVLNIRTFDNLEPETRYIVAIQNLENVSGELVATPQGFKQIRDKEELEHPVLGPLAARYES
ncbi:MAG: hypothetical protein VX475_17790, partial [Myxococcota bacterium]|nr:hypothetical protein [Myxococcota bacterium]